MAKFSNKLIISDIDGTLINSNNQLTNETVEAIKYFMAEGGKFAFATGRNPIGIKALDDAIVSSAPSICYNGSLLYDFRKNESIKTLFIDNSAKQVVNRIFNERPEAAIEIHKDSKIYELRPNEATKIHFSIVKFEPIFVNNLDEVPFPWVKIGFWLGEDEVQNFSEYVKSIMGEKFSYTRVHRNSTELLHKDSDKGFMLDEYRKLYDGVEIIACGDNQNDVRMLKNADISFAPKNAADCAKQAAKYTLDVTNDEHFLKEVIKRL